MKAPDLPKPVFNFLKPVVSYYIAMLISDDIAANVEIMNEAVVPGAAGSEEITKSFPRRSIISWSGQM